MLIRASAQEVFDAFVQPALLTKFWLRKASGPLALDRVVRWEFMVPGAADEVQATRLVPAEHIAFNWSDGTSVDIRLARFGRGATRVTVEAEGFRGKAAAAQAVGATEGFAIVLCDLKSLLETGASGGMVRDKGRLIAAGG
jgi:uncharacterized protein YndB with AHSA1/START domain